MRVLAGNLHRAGCDLFFDEWELVGGNRVAGRLEEGIRGSASGVLVVSPHALSRPWVREEYEALLHQVVQDPERRLIPVLYADAELPPFLTPGCGSISAEQVPRARSTRHGWASWCGTCRTAQLLTGPPGTVPCSGQLARAAESVRPAGPLRAELRLSAAEVSLVTGPDRVSQEPRGLRRSTLDAVRALEWRRIHPDPAGPGESDAALWEAGRRLSEDFLAGPVGAALAAQVAQAAELNEVLELGLEVAGQPLTDLPWEALQVPEASGEIAEAGGSRWCCTATWRPTGARQERLHPGAAAAVPAGSGGERLKRDETGEDEAVLASFAAELVCAGVQMVLAMQAPVTDRYATALAGNSTAASHRRLPDPLLALAEARRAAERDRQALPPGSLLRGPAEWATPALTGRALRLPLFSRREPFGPVHLPQARVLAEGVVVPRGGELRRAAAGAARPAACWPGPRLDWCCTAPAEWASPPWPPRCSGPWAKTPAWWSRGRGRSRWTTCSARSGRGCTKLRRRRVSEGQARAALYLRAGDVEWGERCRLLAEQILPVVPMTVLLDNFEDNLQEADGGGWQVRDQELAAFLAGWALRPGAAWPGRPTPDEKDRAYRDVGRHPGPWNTWTRCCAAARPALAAEQKAGCGTAASPTRRPGWPGQAGTWTPAWPRP